MKSTTTNKDVLWCVLNGQRLTSDRIYEDKEVADLVRRKESLEYEATYIQKKILDIVGYVKPMYRLEIDTDCDFFVTINDKKISDSGEFYFKDFDELNLAIHECVVEPDLFLKDVLNDAVTAMASGEKYFCFDGNQKVELWKLCD